MKSTHESVLFKHSVVRLYNTCMLNIIGGVSMGDNLDFYRGVEEGGGVRRLRGGVRSHLVNT